MLEIKLIPREEFQRMQRANMPKYDNLALLGDMCAAGAAPTADVALLGPLLTAAQTYTILTIGDALVSQIPALIISTAAGLHREPGRF